MRRPAPHTLAVLGLVAAALLAGGLWGGRERPAAEPPVVSTTVAVSVTAPGLREEALSLFASGHFPPACERFSRAADHNPESTAWRQDVARCFEGWAWETLRGGRADEAAVLFQQGLKAAPDDLGLLKGLGVAAIHDGRPQDALAPLERVVSGEPDREVRLLLARLYDQRDEADRAVRHLQAVLERDPEHPEARRLLEKVERERDAEARFERISTDHFVVKSRRARESHVTQAVQQALESAWTRVGAQLDYHPAERVTVVLYDASQFRSVTRVHDWVTGLFDGKIRLPVARAAPPQPILERLVTHEYAHAAIHDLSRGRAPRWLQEGLAQVLEGASADPFLRVPGSLTLSGLEALVTDADPVRARAGYDIALWVTEDLLRRGGLSSMRVLLERLAAGEPLTGAVTRVYGMRLAELESQWRNLLGG
jgi:tetratricopeptide (TPR) repeat protein